MNKMVIAGGIVAVAIIISMAYGASMNPGGNEQRSGGEIWSFRISGEEFNDIQTITSGLGVIEGGTYKIGFVPMGDSPKNLRIQVVGFGIMFAENFILERSLVDTGISKYYTWEYIGQKYVQIPESEREANYKITIIREGNLQGSVSISLSKVDTSI